MACTRGCTGTPICNALGLCCLQIQHDCGKDCGDIPVGYSALRVNAAGALEVCSNVGGVCECVEVGADSPASTITDNGDGTWDHDDGDGTIVTLDVCQLIQDGGCSDTMVNNLNGTWTHTAVDGTIVTLNICDLADQSNCFFQDRQSFGTGDDNFVGVVVPAATPFTVLAPPVFTAINNPSDEPSYCSIMVDGLQISALNTAGTPSDLSILFELSFDGGGTWGATSASHGLQVNFDPAGSPQAFKEISTSGWMRSTIVPPGGTINFGIRRLYSSIGGFSGNMLYDAQNVDVNCTAIPFV